MSKDWSTFLPDVLPEVSTCPLVLALWAVRDTAIRFCVDSLIWQETQTPYNLTSSPITYDFVTTSGSRVAKIVQAQISARQITVLTPESLDRLFYGWRNGITGTPDTVAQVETTKFAVVPRPTGTASLILTVALQPTRDSTQGPDFLFDDYYEDLAAGAKSRLMLMPEAEWANPQQGAIYAATAHLRSQEARERNKSVFVRKKA
jgi:hypothetical protein